MKLTIKQTQALDYLEDATTTELLYGGAAGGGKSVLGCYWIIKNCLKYPGSRWLIGRSELKTLKKTTLNTFFEVCKKQEMRANVHYRFNQHDSIITFPNGSQIILADLFAYPSDPEFDSLGSLEITGAFIDECNQLVETAKNIVKSRIRYRLDEFGLIPKLLMTCNPAKNWVYYEFYQPARNGTLSEKKKFIQALVNDNPNTSEHYIQNLQTLPEYSKQRLLHGNWEYDDDPAALINYESIVKLFTNRIDGGTGYITADIARFGKDKTVIGVWEGYKVRLFTYSGLNVQQSADRIREFQNRYMIPNDRTIADEDGVGGGVVDILRCKGFVNNSRPLVNPITLKDENYTNLKSQCYFLLADYINKDRLLVDCKEVEVKEMIIKELEWVKQHNMDKDGKKQVLPKEIIKEAIGRSPDYADTLMMRMWFDLAPQFKVAVA